MYKKYFISFVLFSTLLSLPLMHNYLFLRSVGETLTPEEVFEVQKNNPFCLYSSALVDNPIRHKMVAYEAKKPDIIAWGSSRSLGFRENFFTKSFYNLGYTLSNLSEAEKIIPLILQNHKPKVIILNVDFWWFNSRYIEDIEPNDFNFSNQQIHGRDLVAPFKWLKKKRISKDDYFWGPYSLEKTTDCNFGALAKRADSGYAGDGSLYYNLYNNEIPIGDRNFAATLDEVDNNKEKFVHGENFDEARFKKFLKITSYIENSGIKLILFFPPIAEPVSNKMQKYNYAYIDKLKDKLRATGIEFYDFQDPKPIGSETCEFTDGYHSGDVAHARMLIEIAKHDYALKKDLNIPYLKEVIKNNKGLAALINPNFPRKSEYDFLNIGCKKQVTGNLKLQGTKP